jgi:hypothetical protein|tara:strand:+ start:528 stop:896 length:369 start_codon:yes stop_codon:yes gene_type:complete
MMNNQNIPVIYEGQPLHSGIYDWPIPWDQVTPPPSAHVWVGKFRSQSDKGGAGFGSQRMGQLVVGRNAQAEQIFSKLVIGGTRYEPDTRNKIGDLGAYRDLPPTDAQLQDVINEAIAELGAK